MDTSLGTFLCPPGYAAPTGLRAIARESSVVSEALRFVGRRTQERTRRGGAGPAGTPSHAPVILVPGFMAGDGSLGLMSRHLRKQGYRTYRSSILANVGCTREATDALEIRVESIAARRGRKVTVVGHSLGGLIARGLAARRPDLVDGIVTMGSPILAPGAAHPILVFDLKMVHHLHRFGLAGFMGEDCSSGECARVSWEQTRTPLAPQVAFTSVFSRRDGVVDWRSCLDPRSATVEVSSSHLGMALDPRVHDVVTRALAAQQERRDARGERVSLPARSGEGPHEAEGSPRVASK